MAVFDEISRVQACSQCCNIQLRMCAYTETKKSISLLLPRHWETMTIPMCVHTCLLCVNLPFKIKISCVYLSYLPVWLYCTALYSTILHSALLFSTLLYLLYSNRLDSTRLSSTRLYSSMVSFALYYKPICALYCLVLWYTLIFCAAHYHFFIFPFAVVAHAV